jgi:hypothetical protein
MYNRKSTRLSEGGLEGCGILKEGDHLEDLGINGGIILKWMLNMIGGCGFHLSGSG